MVYNEQLKKEIPEGWEVKKVKELLDVVTGKEDSHTPGCCKCRSFFLFHFVTNQEKNQHNSK